MIHLFAQTADPTPQSLVDFLQVYWPIVVPVVLGFVGTYFLLPQAGRSRPLWGALVCAAAFITGGIYLVDCDMVLPETILFYAFSGIAVIGGVMQISQQNPVHAALSFALVVLSTCGLFLLQGAPFLMASTIIVYAGAIIVTFLFVIMLAQQAGLGSADQRSREPFLAALAGFVLLGAILFVLQRNFDKSNFEKSTLDVYLDKIQQAVQAKSMKELKDTIGDPATFLEELEKLVPNPDVEEIQSSAKDSPLMRARAEFHRHLFKAQQFPDNLQVLQMELEKTHQAGMQIRQGKGMLQPDLEVAKHLSPSARSQPPPKDGKPREGLPAQNVAGLGRMLFTDYLLSVELAGVLLLVASIGAIVIAGRRTEGLS